MSDQANLGLYREPNPTHSSASHSDEKELQPEPDYDKYAAMMELWSKIHQKAHLSWREGLETARRLKVGERSISVLRKLVTKAMREEVHDVEYVRFKFRVASERYPILQDDADRVIPLALGRLMGMGSPDDEDKQALRCPDLWDGCFVPRTIFRLDLRLAVQYADEIMQLLKTARMDDSAKLATMERNAMKWITKFADCLRDETHVEWLRNWTTRFPEVSGHGYGPNGQYPQLTPGGQPSTRIPHQQSLSTGEQTTILDNVAQAASEQPPVPHLETIFTSVEAMLGGVPPAAEDENDQLDNAMELSNEELPDSNDQMEMSEGQAPALGGESPSLTTDERPLRAASEESSTPSDLMPCLDSDDEVVAGPPADQDDEVPYAITHAAPNVQTEDTGSPNRVHGPDGHIPTPQSVGETSDTSSNSSISTDEASEAADGEVDNSWSRTEIVSFVKRLGEGATQSGEMSWRITDLEERWRIWNEWPSDQEVASLVRELADKHRRPLPNDVKELLEEWEEQNMHLQ